MHAHQENGTLHCQVKQAQLEHTVDSCTLSLCNLQNTCILLTHVSMAVELLILHVLMLSLTNNLHTLATHKQRRQIHTRSREEKFCLDVH